MTHDPGVVGLRRPDAVRGLVSVIIPARDAADWIAEALESVRAQSYRAVQAIVVDDGSSDATAEIATRYEAVVVRTRGAGPGGARNLGMTVASGEFLQFLDADDLLAPRKIARQIAVLEATGADVAWEPFDHYEPTSDGGFTITTRVQPVIGDDVAASLLTTRGFVQIGAMLVRRTPRTDGVWFADVPDTVEDVRYLAALAMAKAEFVSSDASEPGLLFRQHRGPRFSARPVGHFARACVANAVWAEEQWSRDGGLTRPRRAALADAYAFAARQLATVDRAEFEAVAARGAALGPEFTRRLPIRLRWLSRVVGYPRAEAIATGWRRLREPTPPPPRPAEGG